MSTKIAYWDCASGIAGDMCLGALVSAGVPVAHLSEILEKLGIGNDVKLSSELVHRRGQEATKLHVHIVDHDHEHHDQTHSHHSHRHLPEIEKMIVAAQLPPQVEINSLAVFKELAIAEGKVHGMAPEQVHFHEVGALDAIADIVCTCAGLDWLGIDQVFCSKLPIGGGYVNCDHGKLPVPVPAVLKLWEMHAVPVYSNGINKELVTPTGAAIAVTLSQKFGDAPPMTIHKIGLGAGNQDFLIPNILRLWLGELSEPLHGHFHSAPDPAAKKKLS